jgi:hypothetical protein
VGLLQMPNMNALPNDVLDSRGLQWTGISCPECAGVLNVQREGNRNLRFVCRVGHALSVDELLTAKEEKVEMDLWATIRGLEELIALLKDLQTLAPRLGVEQAGDVRGERAAQAVDHVRRLREIAQEKRPIIFGDEAHPMDPRGDP